MDYLTKTQLYSLIRVKLDHILRKYFLVFHLLAALPELLVIYGVA